ncbi:hypothetical protein [Variovorax ginsengisoli]|uniref:Uncharacterized protein n=1 Tax=Variovorax ginsengisoli TaxID=363844 RepID=A0ABT8RZP1_9BURK|nr:hypothetical protein [Variovorax ginsengisoli]MDN8612745.1 hypothetical protein [Variovorax ginsengisoli]MDO1531915.1 hypothetical protein [Variovorax ginsengisoli]
MTEEQAIVQAARVWYNSSHKAEPEHELAMAVLRYNNALASLPSNPEHDTEGAIKAAFEAKYSSSAEDPACAEDLRLFRDGWLEHDTYGAPPVGALTEDQIAHLWAFEWKGNRVAFTRAIEAAVLAAAPAQESAVCRWPWLKCEAPAPCDVCGDAAPSPAEPSEYQLGYQQGRYDEQMAMGPPEEVFERGWNESPAPSEAVKGVSTAEGWQLVPVEPTAEMIEAMAEAWSICVSNDIPDECVAEYRAALLAAPSHPPATPADIDWKAEYDGAQKVLTEIRTALNASGYWPLGMDLVASIRGLLAATPAVAVQAEPVVPDGVWEALQRMIEDGLVKGPASQEDARTVALYRDRVRFLAAHPKPAAPADDFKSRLMATGRVANFTPDGKPAAPATAEDAASDQQLQEIIWAKHFYKGYWLRESDKTCIEWWKQGFRDAEAVLALRSGASAQPAGGAA